MVLHGMKKQAKSKRRTAAEADRYSFHAQQTSDSISKKQKANNQNPASHNLTVKEVELLLGSISSDTTSAP